MQTGSILNGKSLISNEISSKWSLFNKPVVHFFLIAILGLLVYSNTFNVPFHFDDAPNIVENYKLRDLSNSWPPSGSRWFGYLTFALNYYFGELNTVGYHVVNLTIHILNAILVYWLVSLTLMIQDTSGTHSPFNPLTYLPLFTALLFVAHPIQTQAVTYIVQRFTSLATFFCLLSLVMYIKFRLTPSLTLPPTPYALLPMRYSLLSTRYTLYTVSLVSAVLAMKTKEISFTLPVIIALYEFMFFEGKIKRRILFLMPIILTMLIIPLSLVGIDKPIGDAIGELKEAAQKTAEISRWSYLLTQFSVIVTYIRLLFLPINQNLDYDYPIYHSFLNPEVFLSLLFLLLIFAFGIYLLYAKRYTLSASRFLAFGIFWFFITLSVESSIIPIRDVINEHRLYLPSLGIIIVFVSATFYILQAMIQNPKRSLATCCLLLATAVIVLSIATYLRNIIWQNEVTLWEDVAKKSPEKVRGHYNLGKAYQSIELTDKAIKHYQIALILNPNDLEAHYNLGVAYNSKGLTDKAIEHYQIALRLKPDYVGAYNNLGIIYGTMGSLDKAVEHLQIALRLKPDYADAYTSLGSAYAKKGMFEEAIRQYRIALRLNPKDEIARDNLNRILQIQRSK